MNWVKFEDELPTQVKGEQVDILFTSPKWATWWRGMYTHRPDSSLRERLSEYDINKDRFYEWDKRMPTHWMLSPQNEAL